MKHRWSKLAVVLLIAMVVTVPALTFLSHSTTAQAATKTTSTISPIYFSKKSYAKLSDVQVLNVSGQNRVTFTLVLHNGDSLPLSYYDYFLKLGTKSGVTDTINSENASSDPTTIGPGQTVTYHYYANIGSSIKLSDLVFTWMKWNFNVSGYKQTIGTFKISSNYETAVTSTKQTTISTSDEPFGAKVSCFSTTSDSDYLYPSLTVDMKNLGKGNVSVPTTLSYYIETKSGALYPLSVDQTTPATALKPQETGDVALSGNIPKSVGSSSWKLVIVDQVSNGQSTQIDQPLASFNLVKTSVPTNTKGDFVYNTSSGAYDLALNSVNRLPWQDQDILIADVTVGNNGKTSLPLKAITGQFVLDDHIKVDATPILLDNIIALKPGQKAHYRLTAKIPYTYNYSKLSVQLQDKASGQNIVLFSHDQTNSIPDVKTGAAYTIGGVGNQFNVEIRSTNTYTGTESDIFSTQIQLTNEEKRLTSIPDLTAQFVNSDGTVYPATIETIDGKTNAGGTALETVWTSVPKGTATSGLKLLVGESTTGGTLATSGQTADGFIDPVHLEIPKDNSTVLTDLNNIQISPYTLSITNYSWPQMSFNTSAGDYSVKYSTNYTLNKDLLMQSNVTNHKILLELDDADGNVLMSVPVSINDSTNTTGSNFALGTGTLAISGTVRSLLNFNSAGFTLKVYDQFQNGYTKLLASQKLQ